MRGTADDSASARIYSADMQQDRGIRRADQSLEETSAPDAERERWYWCPSCLERWRQVLLPGLKISHCPACDGDVVPLIGWLAGGKPREEGSAAS